MRRFILMISASLFAAGTFAQKDHSGLFLTVDDFKNDKLTYGVNYKTDMAKAKEYIHFDGAKVHVTYNGEMQMLDRHNVYGYRDANGDVYRFVGDRTYQVLNPTEKILIYDVRGFSDPLKTVPNVQERYYFSVNPASVPLELTKENLRKSWPGNKELHKSLDKSFRTDDDLIRMDKETGKYLLNDVISQHV